MGFSTINKTRSIISLLSAITLILALGSLFPYTNVSISSKGKVTVAYGPGGTSIDPSLKSRYGNVIVEDFDNAEGIDLSNTSAGVDTSRGIVLLGGTETFPGKLIFTAMDNAHNGNMGGIAGADQLVNQNAAQQGFGASRWKAMLSSSQQHMKDIIPEPYASSMPIVDRNNNAMYNNWKRIFQGDNPGWSNGGYLRTFRNREVNENTGANPEWSDADGWTGSNVRGQFVNGQTCNDWTNVNAVGMATELDGRTPLREESNHQGSQTLAVMAIELPGSMFSGDKKLGHIHSQVLHNQWSTIGAARITWYENTPPGTSIIYNMTVDDEHWETMENNTNRVFEFQGSKLRWNATMRTNDPEISPAIYRVIIEYDLVSPPEPNAPNSEVWQGTSTPTLEWNFTDPDSGDHQSDYLVEIYSDREMNTLVFNSSWLNSTEPKHVLGEELDDGTYFWRVRTKDIYHAPSNFSVLKKLLIDVTKPVGNITIEDGAPSVNEQLVDISINASDNGSGIADMRIIGDRGNVGPWEEFKTGKRVSLTPTDGIKMISVRFRDHAGIVSDEFNDTVYFDLSGPFDIKVSSPTHPDPLMYYNSTLPVFSWDPPYEVTGIKGYSYTVDNTPLTEPTKVLYSQNSELVETYPGEFSGLSEGSWYFHITPCDVYDQWGNTTHFKFNIDSVAPAVTELIPTSGEWHGDTEIYTEVTFHDVDGFGLELESLAFRYRKNGENSYVPWTGDGIEFEVLEKGTENNAVKVRAWTSIELDEGAENAVMWRISDISGNGPTLSEKLLVKVDLSQVVFSDPLPADDEYSLENSVGCGISISDTGGSGVDGKTIEYSISKYGGGDHKYFVNWTSINYNMVKETLDVFVDIPFDPGKDNYIKWRAKDAVGNGYTESEPSRVWVNSAPVPVIDRPYDGETFEESATIRLNATGTMDNEGDELNYYWEIKGKTSKKKVFRGHGIDTQTALEQQGKYLVYLYVDDGYGFNESVRLNIDVIPKPTEKEIEERWGDTTDTDSDTLPDWWEKLNGLDPDNPNDATPELKERYTTELKEHQVKSSSEKGALSEYWWLLVIAAVVVIILIIIIIFVVVRKKRKKEHELKDTPPHQLAPQGPYPSGGGAYYQPPYSQMAAGYRQQVVPGTHYGTHPGYAQGQFPTAGGGYAPVQGRPMAPYSALQTGMAQQLPLAASQPSPAGSPHTHPALPVAQTAQTGMPADTQTFPNYSLPSFSTDQGMINLNLMALPPAPEDEAGTPGQFDINAVLPSQEPVSYSAAPGETLAGPQPAGPVPEISVIPVTPPSPTAPETVPPPKFQAESSGKSADGILDDIFGKNQGSDLAPPPAEPPFPIQPVEPPLPVQPVPVPETPTNLPPQSISCHACGIMNQVTTDQRPTVVICSSCGAQRFVA